MPSNKSNRRNKRPAKHKTRQSLKERASDFSDSSDLVYEEITALSAIFQEDFNLVSERPVAEFTIQLRPHSVDQDDDDDVSSELVVRCLPGYPHKPPKLTVIAKEGLSNEQSHRLHSLLVEQAASLAREGRVMIYNLTEAAQEFLSANRPTKSTLHCQSIGSQEEISLEENLTNSAREAFLEDSLTTSTEADDGGLSEDVVPFDLFGRNWVENDNHWDEGFVSTPTKSQMGEVDQVERKKGRINIDAKPRHVFGEEKEDLGSNNGGLLKGALHSENSLKGLASELALLLPKDNHSKTVSDILQKVRKGIYQRSLTVKESGLLNQSSSTAEDCNEDDGDDDEDDDEDEYSELTSDDELPTSTVHQDAATKLIQKDLVLAHLLRLVCGARGPLPNTLPALATQLEHLGILPQWVKDLVSHQPDIFDATFRRSFPPQATDINFPDLDPSTQPSVSHFWDASPDLLGAGNTSNSRYLSDFEEISLLGEGGFGHVVLCANKLDGRRYAMKKIRLKVKTLSQNNKILREVATLARLQHHHVVRYYQAWIETGLGSVMEKLRSGSEVTDSVGDWLSNDQLGSSDASTRQLTKAESGSAQTTYLYIQMEYCPRTLREVFSTYAGPVDKDATWRMFRQIVEGLAHIHSRGIIHRDLTPNNIFFDSRNDIKIGDFGLAKFANLEPDLDPNPSASVDKTSGSLEGTGAVGTYFYTAPEILQGWPHIDEKVDMYSLGIVLFELWYQFTTAMERYIVLNDLKVKGILPSTWSAEFESQAKLVKWLTAAQPSERPSAVQLLRSEHIPPRMQDEALNDILRTIQNAEDTTVCDQVVAAIFDDDRLREKAEHADRLRPKSKHHCPPVKKVGVQELVLEYVKEVFTRHGARPLESTEISVLDDPQQMNRLAVKLLDSSSNMLQLRYETRSSFACWIAANQPTSLKRYQISRVYRRGVGNNAPHGYFQGDFDIVGGARSLAEAEVIKVATEVISKFSILDLDEVRVNHRHLLNAVWSWAGVKRDERLQIAQVLSTMGGMSPRSTARKARWPDVRRQLLERGVAATVVDKLQTVERRLSGTADEALARLRGALPSSAKTSAAFDELSMLLGFLRVWGIEKVVNIDALMSPTEEYFNAIYFQIHVKKASSSSSTRDTIQPICLAVGGCYDRLLHRYWIPNLAYSAPGMVGLSIAVQKLISLATAERNLETGTEVLVCSRGGGGLLAERMEVVARLWAANIKAEYMCDSAPSLTEQYQYAHEHGIKWLVIITEAALSLQQTVKVRHLDLKIENEVYLEDLAMHFLKKRSSRHGLY
ncbi:hypothetical protein KC19_1G174500 [Ceratodon purpureus]|uniref:non-specific serine/threonine protein kinase n=1 Tax=Ceratodon purpureus TaxID=3225 RepID=A0A8T0J705_CERPU|nr:hypothetical protein KC19_1G174500 [Ceratodon purpureus]